MAKRRNLKRDIGYVAGELFTEVLIAIILFPSIDMGKADGLLLRIQQMQDDFTRRAHRPDAKENPALVKRYYRQLLDDLQKEIDLIAEELNELSKATAE